MSNRIRLHTLAAATALVVSAMAAPAFAGQVHLQTVGNEGADRFIVKYREGTAERGSVAKAKAAFERAGRASVGGKAVALGHQRRLGIGADVVATPRKLDRVEAEALMREIAADPNVEYVEVDQIMQAVLTPNDTHYAGYQWHYFEAAGGIKADQAWDVSTGAGVVVAVLDTGITNHSDLNANVIAGYDMISDATAAGDGNGRDNNPADNGDFGSGGNSSWHGTHVAGTIGALTNNGKGVAGVAFGAKIQPVRVLGKGGGSSSDILDGIIWASGGSVPGVPANPTPAKVINMSLGGQGGCPTSYQQAIDAAVARGVTVVVAAGNSNADSSGFSPAGCNNVINVASTTRTGARSDFSNYGTKIDVAAPGSDIASTVNSGTTTPSTEGYNLMSGTSMAAPHVAGVAALMISKAGGSLAPSQVESILKSTLRAFPTTIDKSIGRGIVNAKAAVDAVPPPCSASTGGTLGNGVAKSGLCGATGAELRFTMTVPAGAINLKFVTSGGTGDADLYVRFGTAPTTTVNDCKSETSTNAETCTIATAQAGTYHVLVKGYSAFSGASLTGSHGGVPNECAAQTYSNAGDYGIRDNSVVESPITVSNRTGCFGAASTPVAINVVHTFRGDLKVELVVPDGSVALLKDYNSSDSADNVVGTANVDLSTKALNGTWKLRVTDNSTNDVGYINSWSMQF